MRNRVAQKQIPGYAGYIPGVASENVYGQTYGKATYASSAQAFPKGVDLPAHVKYGTSMKDQFKDHANNQDATVASTVGVQRAPCTYKKPIDPVTIRKFYGCVDENSDEVVANEHFKKNAEAFYNNGTSDFQINQGQGQSLDAANEVFFGVETKKRGLALGKPIPGYSGTNQRVEADNIFGMTYANAKQFAEGSNSRIASEKGETLKHTSKFMPTYQAARGNAY